MNSRITKIFNLFASFFGFLLMLNGQNKLVVQYVQTASTATSVTFDIMVSKEDNPGTSPDFRLGALTTSFNYTSGAMDNVLNSGASFTFGPTFPGYTFPVNLGFNPTSLKVRATMSTVNANTSSVQLTTTPVLFATVTITSNININFTPDLLPSIAGNPTLQASVYLDGSATATARSLANGTIITAASFDILSPLPIEFSDVSAVEEGKYNKVLWSTASEQNNDKHIVERSANGYDGWTSVAQVRSKNSGSGASYHAYDQKPIKVSYYRIKSLDFDGKYDYSKIVKVERAGQRSDIVQVYPVPTTGKVTLQLETDHTTSLDIQVTDVAGKLLMTSRHDTASGHNEIPLDLSSFHSGTYYIKIDNGVSQYTKRVIKE